ncbi:RNA polymerase sigma-B factor [Actinoalloteichus hoggarensis]|uniref:RNA polymerase sigma factor SigF n=1 Tax=Actinoalloteichus hoggarensis TaxID=1470176 RepID=A0A221W6J7_9PSEU|nr:RNA polymerase sigma factor SigF [Actinoalloteichus hoggarensis]MBB5921314.1 RNA polymerase sigma-B factor [Actinoalloteichus hoggarensis]
MSREARPGTARPVDGERDARGGENVRYEHLAPLFAELAALEPDCREHAALRERLVTEHLPLARHVARRFANRGETQDDLVQVATMGLIKAVDRFDPERGVDFLSYAVPTVMGEVRRHFRDTGWTVRVPRRLQELHLALNTASGELSQTLGRAPTPRELAERLEVPVEQVYEGLAAGHAYRSSSLDEMLIDDESLALGDTLGRIEPELENVENREVLQPLLATLPQRDRTVLLLRFFANLTQTQIAERVGISQMHVSRLLARALRRLREEAR